MARLTPPTVIPPMWYLFEGMRPEEHDIAIYG